MATKAVSTKWEAMKRQSATLWQRYSEAGRDGFKEVAKANKTKYTANAKKMKGFAKRNGLMSDYNHFFGI